MSKPSEHLPADDWNGLLSLVRSWAKSVKVEIETEDLWSELAKERQFFEAAATSHHSNERFSADEIEKIKEGLDKIEKSLLEQISSSEYEPLIIDEIRYLKSAVDRMSKTDWLHTAAGVFMTIVVGVMLAPDNARALFLQATNLIVRGINALP